MGMCILDLCTMNLLLIWSLLWGMESQHRAKADVCFSKQHTESNNWDGDSNAIRGQQLLYPVP